MESPKSNLALGLSSVAYDPEAHNYLFVVLTSEGTGIILPSRYLVYPIFSTVTKVVKKEELPLLKRSILPDFADDLEDEVYVSVSPLSEEMVHAVIANKDPLLSIVVEYKRQLHALDYAMLNQELGPILAVKSTVLMAAALTFLKLVATQEKLVGGDITVTYNYCKKPYHCKHLIRELAQIPKSHEIDSILNDLSLAPLRIELASTLELQSYQSKNELTGREVWIMPEESEEFEAKALRYCGFSLLKLLQSMSPGVYAVGRVLDSLEQSVPTLEQIVNTKLQPGHSQVEQYNNLIRVTSISEEAGYYRHRKRKLQLVVPENFGEYWIELLKHLKDSDIEHHILKEGVINTTLCLITLGLCIDFSFLRASVPEWRGFYSTEGLFRTATGLRGIFYPTDSLEADAVERGSSGGLLGCSGNGLTSIRTGHKYINEKYRLLLPLFTTKHIQRLEANGMGSPREHSDTFSKLLSSVGGGRYTTQHGLEYLTEPPEWYKCLDCYP